MGGVRGWVGSGDSKLKPGCSHAVRRWRGQGQTIDEHGRGRALGAAQFCQQQPGTTSTQILPPPLPTCMMPSRGWKASPAKGLIWSPLLYLWWIMCSQLEGGVGGGGGWGGVGGGGWGWGDGWGQTQVRLLNRVGLLNQPGKRLLSVGGRQHAYSVAGRPAMLRLLGAAPSRQA